MDQTLAHQIDIGLRAGAAALLLLLGLLLARSRASAGRLAAVLAFNLIAYAFVTLDDPLALGWLRPPLIGLASGCSVILLVFVRALFEDEFRPTWRHAAAWAALCALGTTAGLGLPALGFLPPLLDAVGLAVIAVAAARLALSWRGDLVATRRRARVFIAVAGLAHGLLQASACWRCRVSAPTRRIGCRWPALRRCS